jgi:hypothetical protein
MCTYTGERITYTSRHTVKPNQSLNNSVSTSSTCQVLRTSATAHLHSCFQPWWCNTLAGDGASAPATTKRHTCSSSSRMHEHGTLLRWRHMSADVSRATCMNDSTACLLNSSLVV